MRQAPSITTWKGTTQRLTRPMLRARCAAPAVCTHQGSRNSARNSEAPVSLTTRSTSDSTSKRGPGALDIISG